MANFCMKCGAKLEENVKFCMVCGASVDETEKKMASSQYVGNVQTRTEPKRQPKTGNGSGKGIIVALGLVVLALCSAGGYYYYQAHKTAAMETTSEEKDEKKPFETEMVDKSKEEQVKATASAQETPMDKAMAELAEYEISGKQNFISTTYGHSSDGFIAATDSGLVVVVDRKNHRAGMVRPRMSLQDFQQQKKAKSPTPMLMDCTFANDARDNDADAGYWQGGTHYMTIYAVYKFDDNGNLVPGMLTTGRGEKPSHYQEVLYEVKNVDFANLFLTEASSIKL